MPRFSVLRKKWKSNGWSLTPTNNQSVLPACSKSLLQKSIMSNNITNLIIVDLKSFFKSMNHINEAAVKASYVISHQLVLASKPFSDGEMIKNCIRLTTSVCYYKPVKKRDFGGSFDVSCDLNGQLSKKSIDITGIAQFSVFILIVDNDINITEESFELIPMKVTTTTDDKLALSLVTDEAPEMMGRKIKIATNLKQKIIT
ncbi:hypothetical protein RF11_09622 [Thelohanellus kitauei]|uniref:Uncharacterized protein n=1 Tax=Thelohanellus kitauei TaxID=669202 RepID=A0A0C2MF29_THEKT|nr:hypothetical protein RF11_09622 [Thelohanellus kitauei]